MEVRTDDPDLRFSVGRVMATDPAAAGPLTVESVRWHSGRLLIRFDGIADRNQAEECAGPGSPWIPPRRGRPATRTSSTTHELIGLAVVTTSGEPVAGSPTSGTSGRTCSSSSPRPPGHPAGPEAGRMRRRPDEAGPAGVGPVPTGPAQAAAARGAQHWRAGRGPAAGWVPSCWSRSWPRSCRKSTWPRDGSSSTPRQACSNWAPGPQEAEASRVRIDIITIFPDYFTPLSVSLLGKAASRGDIELQVHDLRNWAHGVHRAVDDAPFGGGPGMVMSPEPWGEALDAVAGPGPAPPGWWCPPPGHPVHARRWRRNGPGAAGWSLPAAGTRESTRGSWTRRATGCRSMR